MHHLCGCMWQLKWFRNIEITMTKFSFRKHDHADAVFHMLFLGNCLVYLVVCILKLLLVSVLLILLFPLIETYFDSI